MRRLSLSLALVVLLGPALAAQDQAMPKPGPEHEFLAKMAGTWDCAIKSSFVPGQPATDSKGVVTNKVGLGGFFVIGDFKGAASGMNFEGHSLKGYDTNKKKYTGVWADSMGSWFMVSEGTLDKNTRILTEFAEGPDMTGKNIKYKMTTEFKDNDNHVFNMYIPDDKGKEANIMTITYKRRK